MRLQPPDQISTLLIWVSAVFMAVRGGVETWPAASKALPFVTDWHWLGLVPLALLLVAAMRQLTAAPSEPPLSESMVSLAKTVAEGSAALAASRPKPPDPNAPKVYVPESFAKRYLDAVYSGKTDIQIDALLRPHLNQWMRLKGKLARSTKAYGCILATLGNPEDPYLPDFRVKFHLSWSLHLSNVDAGDIVEIEAQIVDTGHEIELMNAELL